MKTTTTLVNEQTGAVVWFTRAGRTVDMRNSLGESLEGLTVAEARARVQHLLGATGRRLGWRLA